MAPRAAKTTKTSRRAAERRKRLTGADAKPRGSAQPKQMSQAQKAFNQASAGKFDYDLAWHEDCVFDLDVDEPGILLDVFADGSAVGRWEDEDHVVPRGEELQYISTTLLDAYDYCLDHKKDFVLWIAGERFTGTPKEAFEAVLRLLRPSVEAPKRMLALIEERTMRIQLDQEYGKAALSDARMLSEAESRLRSSGAIDDPSIKQLVEELFGPILRGEGGAK
jgi:hypothetical protein